MPGRRVLWCALAVMLAGAACSDDEPEAAPPSSTASTSASASGGTASSTTTAPAPACRPEPAAPGGVPLDWDPTDFDGDGKPDTILRRDETVFEVQPTSGRPGRLDFEVSDATVERISGVDVNGDGKGELILVGEFAGDRRARVAVFVDCTVRWLQNADGQPYEFVMKQDADDGAGVGCVDVNGDGRTELVGTQYVWLSNEVEWTRTVVKIENGRGVNGRVDRGTFTMPGDRAKIATLGTATCGEKKATAE